MNTTIISATDYRDLPLAMLARLRGRSRAPAPAPSLLSSPLFVTVLGSLFAFCDLRRRHRKLDALASPFDHKRIRNGSPHVTLRPSTSL